MTPAPHTMLLSKVEASREEIMKRISALEKEMPFKKEFVIPVVTEPGVIDRVVKRNGEFWFDFATAHRKGRVKYHSIKLEWK